MAELNTDDSGGGKKGKHGKKRAKKSSTKIDMTPMVDLAFLLLTFFMLTTTFSKPKAMEIGMPADPKPGDPEPPKINNAITLLLTEKDKVFYYMGEFKPKETQLQETNFSKDGLHKVLLDNNQWAKTKIEALDKQFETRLIADTTYKRMVREVKQKKEAIMALVKTDDKASYKNVIDMLDELNVCFVGKYALIDISPQELEMMNKLK